MFTGRPVDVLVCRATADSLVRAARAAYLISTQQHRRPVLAVNTADIAGPSRPSVARMRLLEPHTAGVVVLPYVRRWRDLATPLQDVTGLLTRPVTELPRPLRRFATAVHSLAHSLGHPRSATPRRRIRPLPTDPLDARLTPPRRGASSDLPPLPRTLVRPRPRHHATCPTTGSTTRATAGADSRSLTASLSWMKWGVVVVGVVGLLTCAMMIIIGRRNRSATAYEGLVGSAWVLAGLGLASVATLIVGAFQLGP